MILLLAGCAEVWIAADAVVEAPGADLDVAFGDPEAAVNGVRGGGCCSGSTDVYSLQLEGPRSSITVAFPQPVVDGDGPDLVVFENPFEIGNGGVFIDPMVVEVSEDGEVFEVFPWRAPATYSSDPADWSGLAGVTPVAANVEDPTAPAPDDGEAGGDRFDLAELGLDAVTHVRLRVDGALPYDLVSNGPDVDGVYGRTVR